MLCRYLTHPLASVADALEAFDSAWEGTSSGTQCVQCTLGLEYHYNYW
jgi:hypothetical protein